MFERRIETSAAPHVTVDECQGSLTVRGAEEPRIVLHVHNGGDEVTVERDGETCTVAARADCTLVCPSESTLTIQSVLGNLSVEGVEGPVAIGTVQGNSTLHAVGPIALERGLGNLSVRGVAGDLKGQDVRGNARIRGVDSLLALDQVGGNLVAEGLERGLEAKMVRGNVRLGPPFAPEATYRVNADGNLTVLLPEDANLSLALRAGGRVRSSLPGLVLEEVDGEARGALGAGGARLEAEVRGNASLRPAEPAAGFEFAVDLGDLGAQIECQVNQALAEVATKLEEGLSSVDSEAIRRRVERATEEARRKAERAAERARMRAERAERRWQRASGRQPPPKRKSATDEERLQVLRMVEQGRITPEQASELLAALEGR